MIFSGALARVRKVEGRYAEVKIIIGIGGVEAMEKGLVKKVEKRDLDTIQEWCKRTRDQVVDLRSFLKGG